MPLYIRICRHCGHLGYTLRTYSSRVYRCISCVVAARSAGEPKERRDIPELAELESKWYPPEGEVPVKTKANVAVLEPLIEEIMFRKRRELQAIQMAQREADMARKEQEFQASKAAFDQLASLALEPFQPADQASRPRYLVVPCNDQIDQSGYNSYGGYGFDAFDHDCTLIPRRATATWQGSDLQTIKNALAYQRQRVRFYQDAQPCALVLVVDTHTGEFDVM